MNRKRSTKWGTFMALDAPRRPAPDLNTLQKVGIALLIAASLVTIAAAFLTVSGGGVFVF